MLDSRRGRIVAVLAILVCHALLFSLYAQQPINPDAHVYPGVSDYADTPDPYIGHRVVATGFVREVSPVSIRATTASGAHTFRLTGTTLSASVGDKVRVFGELTGPRTIRVLDGFVVPPRGRWYAWGVSFLSGLWVLGRLVAHWRIDFSTLGFTPREQTAAVRDRVRSLFDSEEDS